MKAITVSGSNNSREYFEQRLNEALNSLVTAGKVFEDLKLVQTTDGMYLAVILYKDSPFEQGAVVPASQPVQDKPATAPRLNAEGKPE